MSNLSDLRITVDHINGLLEKLCGNPPKLYVGRSYGSIRVYVYDGDKLYGEFPCKGPKDSLLYAEGMEAALELLAYGKERWQA